MTAFTCSLLAGAVIASASHAGAPARAVIARLIPAEVPAAPPPIPLLPAAGNATPPAEAIVGILLTSGLGPVGPRRAHASDGHHR